MKKIVNRTLAAIALSIVMISTIDARDRGDRAGVGAKELLQASKQVIEAPRTRKKDKATGIVDMLREKGTAEEEELKSARIKEADLEKNEKLQKMIIADIGHGWFGFGTSKETQEKYKAANTKLSQIRADLKDTRARISKLESSTGKKWSKAVKVAIGAVTTAGILAVSYGVDKYKFEGAGMKYIGEQASAGREYAGEMYRRGKNRVVNLEGAEAELYKSETDLRAVKAELRKARTDLGLDPDNAELRAKVSGAMRQAKELEDDIAKLRKEVAKSISED